MKKEQWLQAIAEQAKSGMSAAAYCRAHGLNEKSFYRQRIENQSERKYATIKPVEADRLIIELCAGAKLYVTLGQLKGVLDVLRN